MPIKTDKKIKGIPQTAKKIDKVPLEPNVLKTSFKKWKKTPRIIPIKIFKYCLFFLDFFIDKEQPKMTIDNKVNGNDNR